jgi:hypothetical protein
MSSSRVQVGRISEAGEDLFEVMDGHSAEMAEYHSTFFESKDWITRRAFAASSLTFYRWIF